jgi:5-methylcytosine-specific restriction endonuclease McrA
MSEAFRLYDPHELGADGYPPAWHEILKHQVRDAAGHRCIRCLHPFRCGETPAEWSRCDDQCAHSGPYRVRDPEVPDDPWWEKGKDENAYAKKFARMGFEVEAKWRVLTVHHLDGSKANCRWWNLAALCQRCHLQIQGRVRMERTWPWEHTPWFRPYVAGFYAFSYLGEDLPRDQVEARLDELLALERTAA